MVLSLAVSGREAEGSGGRGDIKLPQRVKLCWCLIFHLLPLLPTPCAGHPGMDTYPRWP